MHVWDSRRNAQAVTTFLGFHFQCAQVLASFVQVFPKRLELAGARGLAQLAQGFGFDLANAFARDRKSVV